MGSAMIVTGRETCTGCGQCLKIRHDYCISLVDRKVTINCDYYSTGAQRVAVGPQPALPFDGTAPVSYDGPLLLSAEGEWGIPVLPGCSPGFFSRLSFRRYRSLGRGARISGDEQPYHDSARTTEHERRIET